MRLTFNGVHGEIDSLPGCSQVGVSHAVFAPMQARGKGMGAKASVERTQHMKHIMGYDYALCTVAEDNKAQIAIVEGRGWKKLDEFYSSKTDHMVYLYGKVL